MFGYGRDKANEFRERISLYCLYIDDVSSHPALLIQLHGAGERGNGGDQLDIVLVHGFSKIINGQNFKDCVLVMPQCPADSFWVAKIESLRAFIDQMIEKYSIDVDRIYLCGFSMGGYGPWYTAMAYPELFAAIAPIRKDFYLKAAFSTTFLMEKAAFLIQFSLWLLFCAE